MTEENKKLLFIDLCSRLPYKVKVRFNYIITSPAILEGIDKDIIICDIATCELEDVKPYLFPLSSMTEKQKHEYNSLCDDIPTYFYEYGDIVEDIILCDNWGSIDYLMANHFDYRGLIEKGLAIDATGLNIY